MKEIVVVMVISLATLQDQAVALATGKLKVVVVVNQQYLPTKVTNVAVATAECKVEVVGAGEQERSESEGSSLTSHITEHKKGPFVYRVWPYVLVSVTK